MFLPMPPFKTLKPEARSSEIQDASSEESTNLPRVPMRTSATLVWVSKVAVASTTTVCLEARVDAAGGAKLKLCPRNDPSRESPKCTPLRGRIATALTWDRFSRDAGAAGASAAPVRSSAVECIMVEAAMAQNWRLLAS